MPLPSERTQLRTLTHAFLARFFENEATATATDMREGFFWLISALATPGIFLPLYMYFRWAEVASIKGIPAMHATVLFDKTIYLDLTFVGIALLTAVIWHALLVDRRDGLILGVLPVRARTVVLGKLSALLMYVGLVSAGMHGAGTVLYGLGFASLDRFSLLFRFMAGQLIGATAAGLFVFAVVVGAQCTVLAIWGPRRFPRISSLLQVVVIGAATGLLLLLPLMISGAQALSRSTAESSGLIYWLPPMWFVGLNEVISGTTFAVMPMLATRALVALGLALGVVAVTYPLAASRVMKGAVQGVGSARGMWARSAGAWLTRRLGRTQHERGALQFMLAAMARSHQQRLVIAVSVSAALTLLTPIVLMYLAGTNHTVWRDTRGFLDVTHALIENRRPSISLIAAPLLLNFALVAGLRMAMALPSELPSSWLFEAAPSPMFAGRDAARRLLIVVGVVLPMTLVTPVWLSVWDAWHVLPIAAACTLGTLTIVEAVMWGFVGMPCAKALAPGRSNLPSRWPWAFVFLYFYTYVFPVWQVSITERPGAGIMLVPPLLIWWFVRRGSRSAAYANGMSGDPHGYLLLDLSTTAARKPTKERHA